MTIEMKSSATYQRARQIEHRIKNMGQWIGPNNEFHADLLWLCEHIALIDGLQSQVEKFENEVEALKGELDKVALERSAFRSELAKFDPKFGLSTDAHP